MRRIKNLKLEHRVTTTSDIRHTDHLQMLPTSLEYYFKPNCFQYYCINLYFVKNASTQREKQTRLEYRRQIRKQWNEVK